MNDYEPSPDFGDKVMQRIRREHYFEQKKRKRQENLFRSKPFSLAVSSGALIIGVVNLVRIYLALFSPLSCM